MTCLLYDWTRYICTYFLCLCSNNPEVHGVQVYVHGSFTNWPVFLCVQDFDLCEPCYKRYGHKHQIKTVGVGLVEIEHNGDEVDQCEFVNCAVQHTISSRFVPIPPLSQPPCNQETANPSAGPCPSASTMMDGDSSSELWCWCTLLSSSTCMYIHISVHLLNQSFLFVCM